MCFFVETIRWYKPMTNEINATGNDGKTEKVKSF